ncbi:helix-turn-helix transcriptional regulator [Candidatus Rariloculus sp.]|uniref:helix-turn-helix transcriptional regulator n=1 Tax=Candidatus Rariloculus sp. TaxID=3101265 RepID=UPI003D0B935A
MNGNHRMRYERATDIVRLATRLQGARGGLTLDDIREEFAVSRRTAERLRDAVEAAFGPLEVLDTGDRRRHWRLQSTALRGLVRIAPEELAELESAARRLDREGLAQGSGALRELAGKLRALHRPIFAAEMDADLEVLMRAEGLAMRPGPRPRIEAGLLSLLRDAIAATRSVEFDYLAHTTGRQSRQRIQPYGVLYGNRAYLVGHAEWADGPRLWRLANVSNARATNETFERDPAFDLQRYAERSFGAFQEPPVEVVLRFDADVAGDAGTFLFHPSQTVVANADGSLTVTFRAGGLDEMCWHLITWRESVTVEKPARLRRRLAGMCKSLAAHHGAPDAVGG